MAGERDMQTGVSMSKVGRIAMAAGGLAAWALAFGTPAQAQQGAPSGGGSAYTLRICNNSSYNPIDAAIAVFDRPGDSSVTVRGWFRIARGACSNVARRELGNFSTHGIYVHAQYNGGAYIWPGPKKDIQLCIDPGTAYTRVNSSGYTCGGNEKLRWFSRFNVAAGTNTWTFTD
jgi:uncharacterized membrane protein